MNTLLLLGALLLLGGWQTAAAQSPPATPANLSASAGDAQATLSWNNPNDSSITKYQVRYGAGSTVPASATWGDISGSGAATTSHKVTGLTNFTAYAFEIRAVNAHGNSGASAVVTATPLLAAPDAPGNFTVTPGDNKVTLNWELPDNTSEIDKVTVRYHEKNSSNQATTIELTTNATTHEIGGLTNGTLYTFVVEVENRAGSSQVAMDARPALAVPAAPTGLTATAGNTTVTLTWDDPSDTSITRYRLRYGAGSTVPASANWGDISGSDDQTTTHVVSGLTNGTQYAFEIRAVNAGGNSDASATATATPTAPPQARTLTYTFTDNGTTTTITASGSLDLSAFTYDPFDNVAGAQSLLLNDRNIWSVEPPGSNAARRYNNVNLVTTGSDSYTGTSNLSLAGRNYSTDLHVRLSAGSTYLRLDAGRFNSQHVYQVTNATATFTGTLLDTLGDNDFHVEHAFGIQKIVFKATPPKPAAPTGLAATADSGKVTLNWTDPSNNTISKYQLRYGQGATVPDSAAWGDIAGSGATTTRHEVTGLTNDIQYAFEIRAVNSGGESDASGTVTATPISAVPSFGTQTIADQRYGQGAAIATLTLPQATGGDVPLTYSLTPNAPSGLAFDATNRTLTGTPNTVQSATAYTYTVTDADGDTASLAFNITIAQPRTLTFTFSDDGSTVTIAASGSLDTSGFNFDRDGVPPDLTSIRMNDTDIWGIHPPSTIPIKRYGSLPDFVTTGETSYGGTSELRNMVNYSSSYYIRFSTYAKYLEIDSANVTGDIYQVANGAATFDGTLQSTLGDNDFDIEFAIGNQKIVFQTANPATVPNAPNGLAATAGNAQVDLAWTNPNDSNITKYQVRYGAGSTVPTTATWEDITGSGAGTTTHTVAGLTNATEYAFEIRAVNARGNSAVSATVTATPTAPTPARTLTLTFSDDGSTVTVEASGSLDVSGFSDRGDTTRQRIGGAGTLILINDEFEKWQVSVPFEDPTPLREYRSLPAFVTTGLSSYSGYSALEFLSNYSTEFNIRLNSYYKALFIDKANLTGNIYDPTGDKATFSGTLLTTLNDNDFHIEIAIGNQKIIFKATPPPPAAPTGLSAAPGDTEATLTWDNPNDSSITKYQVRYGAGSTVPATATWGDISGSDDDTTTHTVTGLTNTTQYAFEIRAVNATGNSDASATVTATPALAIPDAPTSLTATAGNAQASLSWTLPTNASVIGDVQVRWKATADLPFNDATDTWTSLNDGTATTYTATSLTNGTGYTFAVRATNTAGNSTAATATATPTAPPGRTLTFTFSDDGSTTTIAASGSLDMSGFREVGDTVPEDIRYIKIDDTENWAFHPSSLDNTPSKRYDQLPDFNMTGRTTYTGTTSIDSAQNYSNDFTIRFNTFRKYMVVDTASLNGDIYSPAGKTVTLSGTVLGTFGDNDFRIELAIGNQKIVYTATPPPAPAAPTNLSATAGDTEVTLNWANPNDSSITKYQVRYGAGSTVPATATWGDITGSGATTTSHKVTGLTNATQYAFEIRAVNANGDSDASGTVTATPALAVPAAPTEFSATAGNAQASLSWTLPTNASVIGDVQVRWKATADLPFNDATDTWTGLSDGTATSYIATGLTNGTGYTFEVRATNTAGNGAAATATATPAMPPAAPTGLAATAGDTTVTLNWTDPNDSNITTYQLRYGAGTTVPATATWGDIAGSGAGTTSHMVTGLTNGTQYAFEIRAVNAGGPGPASEQVVMRPGPPLQPGGFRVVGGNAQVTLSWDDPPSDTTITRYQLRHKEGTSFSDSDTWSDIANSGATTTTHTVTGLTNGATWAFQIRAVNAAGAGPASETLTMLPRASNRAPVFRGAVFRGVGEVLSSSYSNARLTKGFSPRFSDPDGDELTFTWTANPPQPNLEVRIEEPGWSTVNPESQYLRYRATGPVERTTLTLTGTDPYGLSVSTSAVVTTSNTAPKAKSPPYPDQTLAVGNTLTVNLTDMFVDDEGDNIRLFLRTPDNGNNIDTTAIDWGAISVIAHTPGEEVIELTVKDLFGAEGTDSFKVTVIAAAAKPAGLTAASGNGQAVLTWTDPADASITKYQLRHKAGTSFSEVDDSLWTDITGSGASTTSHTVTGLTNGTDYVFQVRAVNAGGVGTPSDEAVLRLGAPLQPSGFRVLGGNAQVTLSWNDPSDATITRYQLRRKVGTSFSPSDDSLWTDIANSGATTTTLTVSGLTNGATWAFQIRAVNANGAGPASETLTMLPRANNRAPVFRGAVFRGSGEVLSSSYSNARLTKGFSPRFSDPDGDDLTFTWTANPPQPNLEVRIEEPGWSTVNPESQYLRYRATGPVERTTLTLTGTDPYGLSVSTSAVVTTSNTAPKAKSPPYPDQTLAVGNTLTVNLTDMFVDDEGDNIRLFLRTPDNGNNIDTTAIDWGAISVLAHTPGEEVIELIVKDLFGAEGTDSFKVTVIAAAAAPAGFTATSGDTQAVLAWTDPGDSGITKYQSRHKAGTSFSDSDDSLWTDITGSGASTTGHTVTELTNGTDYVFQIRAVNAGGPGAASDAATATPALAIPDAPSDLGAEAGGERVVLRWTLPTNASTIGKVQVRWKATNGLPFDDTTDTWTDLAATAETYTATGLTNGTGYTFEVRAVNSAGNGQAATTTATPVDPVVLVSTDSLEVGANGSLTFTVTLKTAPSATVTVAVTSDDTDVTVSPPILTFETTDYGTAQTVTVRMAADPSDNLDATITLAASGGGYDAVTASVSVREGHVPVPVINSVTSGDAALVVDFSWDKPEKECSTSGLVFEYRKSAPPDQRWGVPADPNNADSGTFEVRDLSKRSFTIGRGARGRNPGETGAFLANDIEYDVRLIANHYLPGIGCHEYSAWSNTGKGTPKLVKPDVPTNLTAVPGEDRVALGWRVPTNTSKVEKMQVRWKATADLPFDDTTDTWTDLDNPGLGDRTDTAAVSYDATGLTADTAYTFAVRAVNDEGHGEATIQATPSLIPGPPENLTATAGDQAVTLSWSAPTTTLAPDGFQVRWKATADLPFDDTTDTWTDLDDATATTWTATGLTNETSYTFEVRAFNTGPGQTKVEGPAATTDAKPVVTTEAPVISSVAVGDQALTINWVWDKPSRTDCEVTGRRPHFAIQYSKSSPGYDYRDPSLFTNDDKNDSTGGHYYIYGNMDATSFTIDAQATGELDSEVGVNLENGKPYKVRMWAYSYTSAAGGCIGTPFSNEAFGTPALPIPDAPTSLSATAGDTEVTLSWVVPTNASQIEKVQVRWKTTASLPFDDTTDTWTDLDDATATTHKATGLTNDTAYTFEVRAVNSAGDGEAATTTATPVPSPALVVSPTSLRIKEGESGTFTVALATAPTAAVTMSVTSDDADVTLSPSSNLSFSATSYATAQTVTVSMAANPTDGDATIALSAVGGNYAGLSASVTVGLDNVPGFAADASIDDQSYTQNTAIATLTLPEATSGDGTLTYTLTPAAPDGLTFDAGARTLTGTPTTPQAATQYTWTATDEDGDATTPLTFTIRVAATLAVGGVADANQQENAAYTGTATLTGTPVGNITWALSGDDVDAGGGEGGFTLSNQTNTGATVTLAAQNFESPADDNTDNVYDYTLTATDQDNNTATVDVSITITNVDEAPAKPANFNAAAGDTTVTLTWDDPQNGAITRYQVRYATGATVPDGTTWADIAGSGATTTTHEVTGLTNDTQYAFQVRAFVGTDEGPASDTATATPASDTTPVFSTSSVADQSYMQHREITTLTLPAATGGDGTLAYTLSPAAPAGLAFNENDRTVSGTPTTAQTATEYTWTVTDTDGDAVSLTFDITIVANQVPSFGTSTVDDQSYTENQAITTLTLPAATGGDGTPTYALTPNAPAGLTFNPNDRTLSGTPTAAQTATAYTWTATDSNGDAVSLTFDITIVANQVPSFGTSTVDDQSYTENQAITTLTLPAATGGDGTPTYALTPNAPAGLTFNPNDRTLFGTPTAAQQATTYTWTATDTDGDAASLTFDITVEANQGEEPTLNLTGLTNGVVDENNDFTSAATLTGAVGAVTWTLGGADADDFTLTNTSPTEATVTLTAKDYENPTDADGNNVYEYTLTATDAEGSTVTSDAFQVTVRDVAEDDLGSEPSLPPPDLIPSFVTATIASRSYLQHTAIATLTLPRASGGDGTLTYTLSPAAPAGLTFDASTRTLTGTPTQAQSATTYTYTATDTDGDTATLTFAITVEVSPVPSFGNETIAGQSYVQHKAIATLTLPQATGGDGTLTYTLSPATPAGLSFDAGTRTLAGTPTQAQSATTYTYTATDTDGDTATLTFTITVEANLTPSFGNETIADQSYTRDRAIAALTLPRASSGDGTLTYALSPAAPTGLSFDATTRTLAGTPTQVQSAATYTYTATDADGDTASLTFSIMVEADLAPSFGDETIAGQSYTQHKAIATLTLPEASGGNGVLTYALSPAAPAGLTFDASTRTLSGAPTQAQSATTYTYTATDAEGDTATLTFSITVEANLTPSFGDRKIADQSYTQNTAIQALTLPRASGGDGTVTYTLSPAAPAGLTLDASARTLTGTPTQAQPATPYTYTATDADGDTATLTFTITVEADLTPSFGDRTIAEQSYVQNTAIATLTLPRASGGDGTLTYTLRPAVPTGLTFDAGARTLTGAPTQAQPATPYTYTATDADGDSASLTFTITVEALPVPASPSGLAASAGDGQVSLRWADPGNGSILRYQVRYRTGSSPGSSPGSTLGPSDDSLWQDIPGSSATTTAYTVSGLTNRREYVFQVRAVNASGAGAASAQVTAIPEGAVSLEAERQAMRMTLSEIARATLAGATEMVGERMRARPGTSTLTLAGRQVSGAGWVEPSLDERETGLGEPALGEYAQRIGDSELLRGSAFTLPLSGGEEADGAPEWTMWGRGDVRSFSGRKHRSDWDGSLGAGWLGVDVRASGQVFAGLALSQSRGEVDYRVDAEDGAVETSLTTVWPYVQMAMGDGGELQLLLGVGNGDAEHRSADGEVSEAALSMATGSVGVRWPVLSRGSVTLSAVTDAGVARMETEGSSAPVLDGVKARSWRVRGGLEAAHAGMAITGSQWSLAPRGTVTVRRDGGDGVTGTGVELGGGVRFWGPAPRLSVDASGHWLGMHSEDGAREWGASIEARLMPGVGGRGLSWSLGPRWGVERSGVMEGEDVFHQTFGAGAQDGVLAARVGYGMHTAGGLMTPYAEMELGSGEDGVQRYGAGVELELREGITATVRGEHREATDADTRIGLDLRVRF